jgi:hypothetical protein
VGEGTSPIAYILPAVAFAAALLYYVYGAVDRMGLTTEDHEAVITEKNFAAGSTTYNTNIVAGRAHTQSYQNPDAYMVGLNVDGVKTGGFVTKEMYEELKPGDRVTVTMQRTRISKQLQVVNVRR